MDKFESMRAFKHVVMAGGFAAAARELQLSRSAVNKLVINLENQLGVQLLHRTTRQVTLTETGTAFYHRCVEILAALDAAEQAVAQLHEEPQGTLTINAPLSYGIQHLAPAITDFMLQYPQLRVQLTLDDRFIDPIEGGFDLTVRIATPPESPHLMVHPIATSRRVLCANPNYLAKYGTPQHPRDLRHHTCLHYGNLATGNQWHLTGPDGEHTVLVQGVLCSNNGEVLREAALKGLGITLLPTFIVGKDLEAGRLSQILSNYHPANVTICLIYSNSRHLSAKVRLFSEFLKQRFQD